MVSMMKKNSWDEWEIDQAKVNCETWAKTEVLPPCFWICFEVYCAFFCSAVTMTSFRPFCCSAFNLPVKRA